MKIEVLDHIVLGSRTEERAKDYISLRELGYFYAQMIHPTAIVHARAELDPTVEVGPWAIVEADVVVGANCRIGPHVCLLGHVSVGRDNQFHAGSVIGDAPQDLKYKGEPTRLRIGDGNVFREHVTVHRANSSNEATEIGSHNFLMAHCHVGHNAKVGNHVIIANGALLGGHVQVDDRAFISGNCLVHQFVRVGTLALMQGGSAVSKDLPPFTIARNDNTICGLNTVGLRRAGFSEADRLELRQLYHALFRTRGRMAARLEGARIEFKSEPARRLLDFLASSKRGFCSERPRSSKGELAPDL